MNDSKLIAESTMVVFPDYVGILSGVSYVEVGLDTVSATMLDGRAVRFPRSKLLKYVPAPKDKEPNALPEGNALAFAVERIVDEVAA